LEKRLLLALVLSALVFVAWDWLMPDPPRRPEAPPAAQAPPPEVGAPEPEPVDERPIVGELAGDDEEREVVLRIGEPGQVGSYLATFSNRGGRLVDLRLANFYDVAGLSSEDKLDPEHWTTLVESVRSRGKPTGSLLLRADVSAQDLVREPLEEALWRMREIERGVEFELAQGTGVRLVKRVRFVPGTYRVSVELEVSRTGPGGARQAGFLFSPAEVLPLESGDKFYVEPQAIAAGRGRDELARRDALPPHDSVPREDSPRVTSGAFDVPADEISFAGIHNKYFAVLMRGADPFSVASIGAARWRRVPSDAFAASHPDSPGQAWRYMAADLVLQLEVPAEGEVRRYAYAVYAGPKDPEPLLSEHRDHEVVLDADLGSFCGLPMAGIGNVLLAILRFFQSLVGNWGVAIILLTLCVRLALFPVNRKSQTAMARFQKKMKRLQPQIDELKKRYADDPAKQRSEQQKLMASEGMVPPLGGCLPVFVQIPIFFGLFSALRTSFDLRQAAFVLWMDDLSKPDRLLHLGWNTHLPLIGTIESLNLLPLLMVVLWVWQQMLMPKPADEQAARMQKMMMFMPVVMGVFLYNYAAGLSLYMITQSGLGILEQTVVKRVWPIDDSEPERGKGQQGWMQRLVERAQEAQRNQRRGSGPGGAGKRKKR
jgi:YidC/Oxa1 family membrane protein insertase